MNLRTPALAFLLVGPLVACTEGSGKKGEEARSKEASVCAQAKGHFADIGRREGARALEGAPPEKVNELQATIDAEVAKTDAVFMKVCEGVDETTRGCLARMEEFIGYDDDRRKANEACPKTDLDLPDMDCMAKAREAMNAKIGACKEPIDAFAKQVFEAAEGKGP